MQENPLDAVRVLVEKLVEACEPIGLQVMGSGIAVGDGEGIPDMLQVMFRLDAELLAKTDDDREMEKTLKEIERVTMISERERKEQEATEQAKRLARELSEDKDGLW